MIKEKSCGVVLFNRAADIRAADIKAADETAIGGSATADISAAQNKTQNEPKFLLLHYPQGHFDFPKGHSEKGESDIETVRRELFEETGIADLKFYDGFKEKISYHFQQNGKIIYKDVFFFLAETNETEVKLSHEHIGSGWFTYKEAREKSHSISRAKCWIKRANFYTIR